MDNVKHIYLPKWAIATYASLGLILVPWIIVLAEYLPTRHVARHWDALWVGFDLIILVTLIITVYFMFKQTVWVIVAASALGTLFIVDAWFDILTARAGSEQLQSIGSGAIELVLSILTYRLVYHVLHQSAPKKELSMIVEAKATKKERVK